MKNRVWLGLAAYLLLLLLGNLPGTAQQPEVALQESSFPLPFLSQFSPDGRYLAAIDGEQLSFWDLRTGLKLGKALFDCSPISASQAPEPALLLVHCQDNRSFLAPWPQHPELSPSLVNLPVAAGYRLQRTLFSPSGNQMLTIYGLLAPGSSDADIPRLEVRDSFTDTSPRVLELPKKVHSVQVLDDGRIITLSDDGIRWWQANTGKLLRQIAASGHETQAELKRPVLAEVRPLDAKASYPFKLILRNGETGQAIAERPSVISYAIGKSKPYLATCEPKPFNGKYRLLVHHLPDMKLLLEKELESRSRPAFTAGDQEIAYLENKSDTLEMSYAFIDIESGQLVRHLMQVKPAFYRVRLSPDQQQAAYFGVVFRNDEKTGVPISQFVVYAWDLTTGRRASSFQTPANAILHELHWLGPNKLAALFETTAPSYSSQGPGQAPEKRFQIRIWDSHSGHLQKMVELPEARGHDVRFLASPDGKRLMITYLPLKNFQQQILEPQSYDYDVQEERLIKTLSPPVYQSAFAGKLLVSIYQNPAAGMGAGPARLEAFAAGESKPRYMMTGSLLPPSLPSPYDLQRLDLPLSEAAGLFLTSGKELELREISTGRVTTTYPLPGPLRQAAISPKGNLLALVSQDPTDHLGPLELRLIERSSGKLLHAHKLDWSAKHQRGRPDVELTFTPDGTALLFLEAQGDYHRLDLASLKWENLYLLNAHAGGSIVMQSGYYTANRHVQGMVAFRQGDELFPFEQFDLRFNRPDRVLTALHSPRLDLISSYRIAYDKRLSRLGFTDEPAEFETLELPNVHFIGNPPSVSSKARISLPILASAKKFKLARLLVTVNDVPIHGKQGFAIKQQDAPELRQDLALELSPGYNRIQVSVFNEQGTESLRETAHITYTAPALAQQLHLIAVGVSDYRDTRFKLNYAAKDAADLAAWFRGRGAKVTLLQNQDVTRESLLGLKQQLMQTGQDDRVVLFLAGHGLLDERLDYYFGTHDMDFEQPAKAGVNMEEIEDLLDGIPARNKLILMDTCHAGEVDKNLPVERYAASSGQVQARSLRGVRIKGQPADSDVEKLLQESFVNLRRGSGAEMLTASAGLEFAYESPEWSNGVFTYALLRGLRDEAADRDKDHLIRFSELRNYLFEQVPALTQQRQNPVIRQENLVQDMVLN